MADASNQAGENPQLAVAMEKAALAFQVDAARASFSARLANRFHIQIDPSGGTLTVGAVGAFGVNDGGAEVINPAHDVLGSYRVDIQFLRSLRDVISSLIDPQEPVGPASNE